MKRIAVILMCALTLTACSSAKTGLGMAPVRSAVNASAENDGRAKATTTSCALTLDKKDRVVAISIDAVESKFDFDTKGKITNDITEDIPTNMELGEEYGLKKKYPDQGEWFEQVDAFEKWAVGKDIQYVLNAENEVLPEGSKDVPLKDIVKMDLSGILEAVQKAYDDINAQIELENADKK